MQIEKTVFISYRHTNSFMALAVYQDLTKHGYDVFFDYNSINGGDFEQVIIGNIKSRAHFIVILTPSALERCDEPNDWLRREIETALDEQRNIVPLMFEGFDYNSPSIAKYLTGKLSLLKNYNAQRVPADFFDDAMAKVRNRYLNIPIELVLHPRSDIAHVAAIEAQNEANKENIVSDDDLTAQEWLEKGYEKHALGEYKDAISNYTKAIQLKSDFADAYEVRGDALNALGEYEAAIKDYSKVILLDPNNTHAYLVRMNMYKELGDKERALKDCNEIFRHTPDEPIKYAVRGHLLRDFGDIKGALEDFNIFLSLVPDSYDGYFARGYLREEIEDFNGAIEDYTELIRLDESVLPSQPYYMRGLAKAKKGDVEGAVKDFQIYLEIESKWIPLGASEAAPIK